MEKEVEVGSGYFFFNFWGFLGLFILGVGGIEMWFCVVFVWLYGYCC